MMSEDRQVREIFATNIDKIVNAYVKEQDLKALVEFIQLTIASSTPHQSYPNTGKDKKHSKKM